ncbi:hypothetical protein [Methylobacterium sp. Leaf117]|uniref:hypothetical protein n=1 Tax=Methylobacterium sp. Leaf117 TaxID=1736260 RepID=UPI0007018EB6|nr:hypothetical protein [Methylobacterium sp. Leaf117]KQP92964.1 hypothetical protein ASF57_22670 [Methylobacterium sp. Leaf117]
MLIKSNDPEDIWEEPEYDLSRLDAEAKVAREHLIAIGRIGYGSRWQAPLARDLGRRVGAEISRAQVNHWVTGERSVPLHIRPHLLDLGIRIRDLMRIGADALDRLLVPPKPKFKRRSIPAASKPEES